MGPEPPYGTGRRIRNRAIWATALFAATLPPAVVGLGIANAPEQHVDVARPMAFAFWLLGMVAALAAAVPTLRYWEGLPQATRWLGALPMVSVSLFASLLIVGSLFVRA